MSRTVSWDNLESKIISQNWKETGETPVNVFQLLSEMLKSPCIIRFAELILALLRKTNKFSYRLISEFEGIAIYQAAYNWLWMV